MQLVCAIVVTRTDPFTVDIDADKAIHDLKEAIKAIFEDIKTPTRCIQLFLAKLRDDESLEKMLQKPVDISEMKKMRALSFKIAVTTYLSLKLSAKLLSI
ncbi:hypothetical protein P3T76_004636 [Phytophthora citrophthora]|uniref:Crinkler effector protein N-terminal domain-containing protein n=1 Tax=Phytophthora citrophthora TaxID=4793 RepID=A0AAD9GR89_9STRA|nr:hypothetical protein P3T76_004636 [Phytophthora citrophthora]